MPAILWSLCVLLLVGLGGACASMQKVQEENKQIKNKNQELTNENEKYMQELLALRKQNQRIAQQEKSQEKRIVEIDAERLLLIEKGKEQDQRLQQYERIFGLLKEQIVSEKFKVRVQGHRLILALPSDLLFPSGEAKLTKEGLATVEEIAQVLRGVADRRFQVEGHTDNVRIRSAKYPSNWELASARSLAVLQVLAESGVRADLLSTASFSKYQPIAANETEEGRALNRRVDISLIPDLSVIPEELLQSYLQSGVVPRPQTKQP